MVKIGFRRKIKQLQEANRKTRRLAKGRKSVKGQKWGSKAIAKRNREIAMLQRKLKLRSSLPTGSRNEGGRLRFAGKMKPLPAEHQKVAFDSENYACYGKQTKRGYRAYCRKVK